MRQDYISDELQSELTINFDRDIYAKSDGFIKPMNNYDDVLFEIHIVSKDGLPISMDTL